MVVTVYWVVRVKSVKNLLGLNSSVGLFGGGVNRLWVSRGNYV